MTFHKYQHIERWGTSEVEGIELGVCHVFPKIDGTNASVWMDGGEVRCGSRNREITPDNDNAGFAKFATACPAIHNTLRYLEEGTRLYGEWLVPHSLKTYRDEAWRNFYVFDVVYPFDYKEPEYIPFEMYQPVMETFGTNYIPPIGVVRNGDYEKFLSFTEKNDFLLPTGFKGEGIVIKNYDFKNRYGRQTWAKIVASEFKEKHVKEMGAPEMDGKQMVEELIAQEFVTEALCLKVKSKIENDKGDWSSKYIPELLGTIYYDVVNEEAWNFVKKHKYPTVNFRTLRTFVNQQVKLQLPEVF